MIHFCEVPTEAVCGECLAEQNFKMFYENTSSWFAAVTCEKCRVVLRVTRGVVFDGDEEEPKR